MNPNSSYYLSFDTGYPNAFDRAHGRTGAHLMVHGSCSSRGCFAMTDEAIAEVYAIGREAFSGGQRNFQFQSYPFRMTAENMAKHRLDQHIGFWANLKEGSDYFEATKDEPKVGVCGKRYVFGGSDVASGDCTPELPPAVAQKREDDERKVADLVAKGVPAIRLVYEDGGQHVAFRETMIASAGGASDGNFAVLDTRPSRSLGDVSRPEALAAGPREIVIDGAGKPKPQDKPSTALAYAAAGKAADTKATSMGKPAVAATAAASPEPAALSASPSVGAKTLYDRVLGNLFGKSSPAEETARAEPAAPPPGTAPLPPRRGAAASGPERRVDASGLMPGAHPVGPPAATGFARTN
jgi:hypothetical protein